MMSIDAKRGREKNRETFLKKRLRERRRAVQSEGEILNALSRLGDHLEQEKRTERIGIYKYKRFSNWKLSPQAAIFLTLKVMSRMLMLTALASAMCYLIVRIVLHSIDETSNYESKIRSVFESIITLYIVGVIGVFNFIGALHLCSRNQSKLWTAFSLTALLIMLTVSGGGILIPKPVIILIMIIMVFFGCLIMMYYYVEARESDGGRYLEYVAAKRAKKILKGVGKGSVIERKTLGKKLKLSVLSGLPGFLILGMLVGYILMGLYLYDAFPSSEWKVFVALFALGVKVVGNKGLLLVVEKAKPRPWLVDAFLFFYEFGTSLMCRILQMSIPDERTAQLVSLASCVVEIAVRILFYVLFLRKGLKVDAWDDKKQREYAAAGVLRVKDSSNDMIVEYLSTIVAALFLLELEPTGMFKFTSNGNISSSVIFSLVAYQLLPEIFLDIYVTFMEIFGGLSALHNTYWSFKSGSKPSSHHFWDRQGDLLKAVILKLCTTICIVCVVLIVVMKDEEAVEEEEVGEVG